MRYQIEKIATIVGGQFANPSVHSTAIQHILLDSRQVTHPSGSLFIALKGQHFDGHDFVKNAYSHGVRNFLVSKNKGVEHFPMANFILTKNTLEAFQKIAIHHRQQFQIPVISITGSNGKTIVKEWLFQLLHDDYHIVRSPKSYNSQIGVPLSVLQVNENHTLGIFEAGISQMGEMEKIAHIIAPEIGIFTTLGEAHSEGFPNKTIKLREKLKLFENAKTLIYCCDDDLVEKEINIFSVNKNIRLIKWTTQNKKADFKIKRIAHSNQTTEIQVAPDEALLNAPDSTFTIPFTDSASIENAIHCWVLMKHFSYNDGLISKKMAKLEPIAMRLELKEGNNGCTIINDSYNSDLNSLSIAIDFLKQQSKNPIHTLILSDILQSGQEKEKLYSSVSDLIIQKKIDKLIGIGKDIKILNKKLPKNFNKSFFIDTDSFLRKIKPNTFKNETVLLKGARQFNFEKVANRLASKVHQTQLEINLTSLLNNLRTYQKHLLPGTKLMVMVKASAYGSGSIEVAKLLEFQQVDYLAVAYADEGVELRKAGIHLPILVLNPEETTFDRLATYDLEPEIYNFNLFEKYISFLKNSPQERIGHIHLKLDTGMHRLGFEKKDLKKLITVLVNNKNMIKIKSVFSHLAGSGNPVHDDFTRKQFSIFEKSYGRISDAIGYQPMRHILNSGGIIRFPKRQMDMVRLGIGLYGIDESNVLQKQLKTVLTLKATISQIKKIKQGDTIGYGRMGKAEKNIRIATISIGYADGLLRKAGNGNYDVLIKGKKAPIIGNVCMDMTMVDVSDIPDVEEGDGVIIFGKDEKGNEISVQQLAKCLDTIPYEIFTSISGRVKRVYVQE